jgi:hypothetical protein
MRFMFGGPLPRRLILVALLHVGLGLFAWGLASASFPDLMAIYFRYLGPAFLLSFAFLEWELARRVRRAFEPGEEMYHAWTLIMIAAGLRCIGMLLAHVIDTRPAIRTMAHVISGPVQMVFLSWGLGIVLRVYRQLGYSFRLNTRDQLLVAISVASAICGIVQNIITPSYGLFTDAMLACLLLQAIVLRRSVAQMGGGLVGACWTSYVVGIFLTALGDVGITIAAYGVIPREWLPITWLIWYPAAAAYAIGPAYLAEAVAVATHVDQRYPAACSSNSSA